MEVRDPPERFPLYSRDDDGAVVPLGSSPRDRHDRGNGSIGPSPFVNSSRPLMATPEPDTMEIKNEDYSVIYDPATTTVNFQGSLRLSGMAEYAPIVELLDRTLETNPDCITLNLEKLEFLNSSGINVLSKFVIKVRQKKTVRTIVRGNQNILWQAKSLKNLQRLMPSLQLEL
jgi:hypothetical protein